MLDVKDPAIKLFGQTIPLPADGESPVVSGVDSGGEGSGTTEDSDQNSASEWEQEEREAEKEIVKEKDLEAGKPTETEMETDAPPMNSEDSVIMETAPEPTETQKTPCDEENSAATSSKAENGDSEKSSSHDKTLKKPDKILPCPRCNSMETKFCYYNNYNVNQPRHFCKSCQRYWTDGGTMRNVPVGAGRRKNKSAASQYRHITISDALQTGRVEAPNGMHLSKLKTNGTVLNFGSDGSLSESMASVLNIAEKTMWNGVRNGFHKPQQSEIPDPKKVAESGDDHSTGSSTVASNSVEETDKGRNQEPSPQTFHGFPSQIPCLPGIPWPYAWNPAVPPPAFCHPAIPMFYPPNIWNCAFPGAWPVPVMSPPSSSPKQSAPSSSPNSPTLGKHSRDGNILEPHRSEESVDLPKQKSSERSVLVPKTLRIDDPDEAAKSSIWATLGIKNEMISKGGLFKGFQKNGVEKKHINGTSAALQANPAALSRSVNFHESS